MTRSYMCSGKLSSAVKKSDTAYYVDGIIGNNYRLIMLTYVTKFLLFNPGQTTVAVILTSSQHTLNVLR